MKTGTTAVVINAPHHYRSLLGEVAREITFVEPAMKDSGFVHYFTTSRKELEKRLPHLRAKLADTGTLWISWPKKSAGISSDVSEDVIRAVALPLGFVDVKVCAVDETWSGLKLVIRREHRRSTSAK
jgi:hypothetical protein